MAIVVPVPQMQPTKFEIVAFSVVGSPARQSTHDGGGQQPLGFASMIGLPLLNLFEHGSFGVPTDRDRALMTLAILNTRALYRSGTSTETGIRDADLREVENQKWCLTD